MKWLIICGISSFAHTSGLIMSRVVNDQDRTVIFAAPPGALVIVPDVQ